MLSVTRKDKQMSLKSIIASVLLSAPTACTPPLGTSQGAAAEVYETSRCSEYGQPEFQFRVTNKAIPDVDIQLFLSDLEQLVANGERFKIGETMQIGWMITKLASGPNGRLVITEPDMKAIPIEFVDSLDNTLLHLRVQKDSVESLGKDVALAFPSLRQSIVVHKNYRAARQLTLERVDRKEDDRTDDSGWWLLDQADKAGNQNVDNFMKISLYQLAIDRPDLVKFLAIPRGYIIVVSPKGVIALKGSNQVQFLEGSFLSELNKRMR
jgi:hypothetical protein